MQFFSAHLSEALRRRLSEYRFEIRHVIVLFAVLITFQVILALYQKSMLGNFLESTQNWFQKYHAERVAILTSSSLELLFQNQQRFGADRQNPAAADIVYSVDVFLKQQRIQRGVQEIMLFLVKDRQVYPIGSGQQMRDFIEGHLRPEPPAAGPVAPGLYYFLAVQDDLREHEKIISAVNEQKAFDVAVPFVPEGEYLGALYMRMTPDFSFLTDEIKSGFERSSLLFSALIVIGLIGIFVVSSHAVEERDDMQRRLYAEHEGYLANQIRLEKESLFTKRIYHTHHKAEKIMGFIKADVRAMAPENLDALKQRVVTYSNFISRIIYDMKWYDQDANTIVNPIFRTNINTVIDFVVRHLFLRISSKNEMFDFQLSLDPALPLVHINEFIVWEILEPLIQNSIDHGGRSRLTVTISTRYDAVTGISTVTIADNGGGIKEELLQPGPKGVKRIFLDQESTKKESGTHSGYGCYIAYQMAVGKCGWGLDVENQPRGGCMFTITIHQPEVSA